MDHLSVIDVINLLREAAKKDLHYCPDLIQSHLSWIASNKLQNLHESINDYKTDITDKHLTIKKITDEVKALKTELGLCKSKLKIEKEASIDLGKQLSIYSDSNEQITDLRIQNANDSQVIKSLRDRCEEYRQKIEIKDEESEKLCIALKALENSVDPLNEQITDLKGQVSYMRGQRKDLEHTTDLLKNQVQNLLDKVKTYQTKEKQKEGDLESFLSENETRINMGLDNFEILEEAFFEIFGRPSVALKVNEIDVKAIQAEKLKEYEKNNLKSEISFYEQKLKGIDELLGLKSFKNFGEASKVWCRQEKILALCHLKKLNEMLSHF